MAWTHPSLPSASAPGRPWAVLGLALTLALPALQPLAVKSQDQRGFGQTANSASAVANGSYYALVIGIDDYPAPMRRLKTAVNDARAVGQMLHDRYGFQVQLFVDADATRSNILNVLNARYRNSLAPSDNLLIYYAGHGYYDRDADKAYWLPVDAESSLSANRISADDLTTAIRALPARHVLVVSDSCYSGGLSRDADEPSRAGGNPALVNRELRYRSRTLMASGGNEPVSDSGDSGHSVFANAVLRALDRAEDPMFTAIDLFYSSIRRQVAGRSSQVPEYSTIRNSNDDDGDFVFVRGPSIAAPSSAEAASSAPAVAPAAPAGAPADLYDKGQHLAGAGRYVEALPFLTSACNGGSSVGCTYVGWMYSTGAGVAPDFTQAFALYTQGCNGGNARGCANLGVMYEHGRGTDKDDAHAVALYRKACDGDDAMGCSYLGSSYEQGTGVVQDLQQAASLYRKGCTANDAYGCTNLGAMYSNGKGVSRDDAQAVAFYRKGCDGGSANGCTNLGLKYENGSGVDKDDAQAAAFYRKGCDGGSAMGCSYLGNNYERGAGVAKDLQQAALFYGKGCAGNDAYGCTDLGVMYGNGTGVAKDDTQAVALYRKGCDGGSPHGCTNLGLRYETGKGVDKDDAQAAALYRKACNGDDAMGCSYLGNSYERGAGVGRDLQQAISLYRKGCDGSDTYGCTQLKRLQP